MVKDYRELTNRVKANINPEGIPFAKLYTEDVATINYSDVLVFVRTAMKGVEPEYTKKSIDAGDRVKTHLSNELKSVVYRYQGSVMTNTHIKGYSDIDLLVICDKFYSYDSQRVKQIVESSVEREKFYNTQVEKILRENQNASYTGNALLDLKSLRVQSEEILSNIYVKCDISKPKAIEIENLSLKREVDVVIANWYDDVRSIINDKGDNRGVQVYDKEKHIKLNADFPFISIERINSRSSNTNGRLKRMIRFLKNIKAFSEQKIDLSSFDINAICYDIKVKKYQDASYLLLVKILYVQLQEICLNQTKADDIVSVDGREYIFRNKTSKLNQVKILLSELEGVFYDLKSHIPLVS